MNAGARMLFWLAVVAVVLGVILANVGTETNWAVGVTLGIVGVVLYIAGAEVSRHP